MVKICLNMIVKNESKIITRLFDTVLPIIDTYLICDTGSTDDTIEIINNYFKGKNIKGKIIKEPFKNFGYNRTFALLAVKELDQKVDYILLLDADMCLVIEPTFKKENLTLDYYTIKQKNSQISYYNTRLIKVDCNAKCIGSTHEYYSIPNGKIGGKLDDLWIDDIGDGGCKSDKFERDILLLTEELKEQPNNSRTIFYLAQSYHCLNKYDDSIKYYQKRIEVGGWIEERWYSAYKIGIMLLSQNKPIEAIFWWLKAYDIHPKRAENIYQICKYYRENSNHHLSYHFYQLGKAIISDKINDVLFIEHDVYNYLFDYEYTILAYYLNLPNAGYKSCQLLNKSNDSIYNNLIKNYKYYYHLLLPESVIYLNSFLNKTINGHQYKLRSSTPCIFKQDNGYGINLRYVSYYIKDNGCYDLTVDHINPDYKIITINEYLKIDNNFEIIERCEMDYNYNVLDINSKYIGIEDIKVVNGKFFGTCYKNQLLIGYGEYDYFSGKHQPIIIKSPENRNCEKNWSLIENCDKIIYKWYPLTIGKIVGDNFIETDKFATPLFFRHIRGSSNGCYYQNEWWFLTHLVEHSEPRHYYHCIVILDNELKIKRWTSLFKLDKYPIEFGLGLIVEHNRILISYSTMDRNSNIGIYQHSSLIWM